MDLTSRWVEVDAVPDAKASTIAQSLVRTILCRYGRPIRLLSDQGSNMLAQITEAVCHLVGTDKVKTTSYHPQTNGRLERFHKDM
eukprot:6374255-Prorocentrum_lima.AAC.1